MSDKRTNAIGRRQRYRRRLRGEKKAVSPVVATLILILIAVAAAAALYLWLVAWQGGVTKGIGSPSAQYTVTIGGSTSVYPFAAQAASWFEQNNSDVVISVNQGGSGAGAAAVCGGQVDIGEMSAFYSASTLETSYGCPSTLNEQIVAYDGVDVITQTANTHGLQNMTWDTLQSVVAQASTSAPTSGFIYEGASATFDGVKLSTIPGFVAPAQGTEYLWDQIPACATADTKVCGTGNPAESNDTTVPGVTVNAAAVPTYAGTSNVYTGTAGVAETSTITGTVTYTVGALSPSFVAAVALGAGTLASSAGNTLTITTPISVTSSAQVSGTATVGFSIGVKDTMTTSPDTITFAANYPQLTSYTTPVVIPAGAFAAAGSGKACGNDRCVNATSSATSENSPCGFTVCAGGTAGIHIYYRSDVSGTTQSFLARLVAAGTTTTTGTSVSLGFTGCTPGDNQFDSCGGTYSSTAATGESGNPLVIQAVSGDANGLGYASDGLVQAASSGVLPVNFQGYGQTVVVTIQGESTALKAIAKGIADVRNGGATYGTDQAYIGWRPFMNAETSPPTGEVLRYLEYVMDPANNQNIAAATAEISVYASGLAGVVPITPVTGYQETL